MNGIMVWFLLLIGLAAITIEVTETNNDNIKDGVVYKITNNTTKKVYITESYRYYYHCIKFKVDGTQRIECGDISIEYNE